MSHQRALVLLPLFGLSAITIAIVGCGSKNPLAPASVSGAVSYKGTPVTGGSVHFVTSGGTPYSSSISLDGTYAIKDLPIGEMAIVVETESVNPVKKEDSSKDASRRNAMMANRIKSNSETGNSGNSSALKPNYVKIPEKYSKAKTSPLTYTVKNGRQVYSIELE